MFAVTLRGGGLFAQAAEIFFRDFNRRRVQVQDDPKNSTGCDT
jgi:hypothetical protein